MPQIRELIISEQQEDHIWTKHRVTPEEVEEVCHGDPWVLRGRDESYAAFGQTSAGRYLVVFLYPRSHDVYSVATAREMTDGERRRFQGARRK